MKAVVVREHGGYEVLRLEEAEAQPPGPGEVQVAIRASGLNHLDTWVRRGVPGHRFPLPMIPGCDGSGVIAAAGAGVTHLKEGDEVVLAPGHSCGRCLPCSEGRDHLCADYGIFGETRNGTNAELLTIPAVNALPKPANVSFEEAAAIPLVFLTAWSMLIDRAGLRPGETVVVLAAGSGVGSAAVQVAKLWGARVIATASSEAKREAARALGADEVLDHGSATWGKELWTMTGRRGADVVVEHVGAPTFTTSLRSLRKGGRLVTCGATAGSEVAIDLKPVFFKSLSILGSTMGSRGNLLRILDHVREGRLRPVLDRVLPLEQVSDAHRLLAERAQFGKIVLVP
jgi:NADPH:quinone reductase-like Zn-dependent oxidoreductase